MEGDIVSDQPTARMFSWARNSAIYRLERRMHTEKQLYDAIARKARQRFEGIGESQIKALAEFAVKFAHDNGALNDQAFAEISSRSGMRNGKSRRFIEQTLARKGVAKAIVVDAVADMDDLHGALVFARKRAFGPFRKAEADEKRRLKELSAFVRGGFGFDIAKRVCDLSREDAEELLYDSHAPG